MHFHLLLRDWIDLQDSLDPWQDLCERILDPFVPLKPLCTDFGWSFWHPRKDLVIRRSGLGSLMLPCVSWRRQPRIFTGQLNQYSCPPCKEQRKGKWPEWPCFAKQQQGYSDTNNPVCMCSHGLHLMHCGGASYELDIFVSLMQWNMIWESWPTWRCLMDWPAAWAAFDALGRCGIWAWQLFWGDIISQYTWTWFDMICLSCSTWRYVIDWPGAFVVWAAFGGAS